MRNRAIWGDTVWDPNMLMLALPRRLKQAGEAVEAPYFMVNRGAAGYEMRETCDFDIGIVMGIWG